jgi:hypothetical protein
MRRISSHIPLIAALGVICLAGQMVAAAVADAAGSPTVNKAALNKAVQEALAKAKLEKSAGAQGATGTSSGGGGTGLSESFSNLTGKAGEEEETPKSTATTSSSSSSSGALSTSVLVPILAVAGILIGGIAFFIVRDARSVAPAGDRVGRDGSVQDRGACHRKRRAKAKSAQRHGKRDR